MNLLLLVVCCMISTSLAGRIDKEAKLETVLNEVEEILQHLKADDVPEPIDDVPEPIGDIQKLESILNDRKPHFEWSSDRGRYFTKTIPQTRLTRESYHHGEDVALH
ncbi:uncharacterized protein LOC135335719 [Halichondria panicea]|uniref:uncharacterized protein LOC135335719 n=1 Tax=Halichondria panicea TaxID=6063 RepID=UPI00312B8969